MYYEKYSLDDREGWNAALKGIEHPCTHTHIYNKAISASSGLATFLYVFQNESGKIAIPLSVRKKEFGYPEIVSPYGFSGFAGSDAVLLTKDLKKQFYDMCISEEYITVFIMQHPLVKLPTEIWGDCMGSRHVLYFMDLARDIEELWGNMSHGHRYEIKKNEKNIGVRLITDKAVLKDLFKVLYRETLDRVNASAIYNFSNETFDMLIGSEQTFLVGVESEGTIEAISLFLYTGHSAEYFLNASSLSGRQYTRLLLWSAIRELKTRGIRYLHLGGGIRNEDALGEFKSRFGGTVVSSQIIKKILLPQGYDYLCSRYLKATTLKEDYFPPYWREEKNVAMTR